MSAAAIPVSPEKRREVHWPTVVRTIAAALVTGLFFLPILWWILASFKPTQEILSVPPKLFGFDPTLNWYRVVLGNTDPTQFNIEATGSVGRGSGARPSTPSRTCGTARSSGLAARCWCSCLPRRRPTRCRASASAGAGTSPSGSSRSE